MRVSLNWLKDYIDLPTEDPVELARAFDMLGHAVEDVETISVGWTDVYIGRVLRIEPHPNADSVRVTYVDLGDGAEHQIICGAWNFEAGAVVPVAIPGSVLPGDFRIGDRTIRGVESHGMICSERELGLGDVHEGIMVLDDDAPIGQPFETFLALPDVVFDLEITNNRPDVMGMVGVARELAAWFDIDYRYPDVTLETEPGEPRLEIVISATDGCNRFVAREMRDVTIGQSPVWMRERLRKAGIRAISNIVDVSNYVMVEMGHPMHTFDADSIIGDRLEVRWAKSGETLETLDGVERKLDSRDLVIVDDQGPTSLAAVMGGARSEVVATTDRVIVEAASWHPPTVMYTSRRHDSAVGGIGTLRARRRPEPGSGCQRQGMQAARGDSRRGHHGHCDRRQSEPCCSVAGGAGRAGCLPAARVRVRSEAICKPAAAARSGNRRGRNAGCDHSDLPAGFDPACRPGRGDRTAGGLRHIRRDRPHRPCRGIAARATTHAAGAQHLARRRTGPGDQPSFRFSCRACGIQR